MELMIFDVRYEKIQRQGTIPNCLRISLDTKYTEESMRQMVSEYSCTKGAASTICIFGLSSQVSYESDTSNIEKYHSLAVTDLVREMTK